MSDVVIKNLSFGYDSEDVLRDIDLKFDVSDFLAIIGPNGGGKSTLLKLMLGLLIPSGGSIEIFGKQPSCVSHLVGYVPQSFEINQSFPLSVLDVVLMGLIDQKKFGFYTKTQKNYAMQSLEKVGMSRFANARISELSGGQRQRVYIARALVSEAKILMLDEPTASVDAKTQAEIYTLLRQINLDGCGVVLVSHDTSIALSFANKIAYVSKTLHLHKINPSLDKQEFIEHLAKEHKHFCEVEVALRECGC
ncbi:metal ion ABC transporter, ATP-binding protein [Campylobacter mucosalis]|uniref:Metal ion ABC transporter, ATP-binding protein n=1 Tax=Campylobacter mucosalis CCUG 21559 TaxID=1032067 RepID=A0A6G5QIY9_9BACT|nr:ABC transporter ATP-binding protein [Campylobacter mucosalis]QCD45579.1 metal ion ABC transporter, ATP-binding protein [Campylobacter mucosalis CCUG 21559]QKF63769.1 metal ion ABC transporter, ATP-binding protein [Campylobacter mucosalis]